MNYLINTYLAFNPVAYQNNGTGTPGIDGKIINDMDFKQIKEISPKIRSQPI
ncbi:MAG: hypothetical protein Q8831_02510 ['Bonamia sp.' little leaf phytoplasma]|nr:hypothetical protein ['Bonamia sp.' little leaf phytoplasma]